MQEITNIHNDKAIRTELYTLIKYWLMKNRPETWANIQTNINNSDPIQKFLAKQRIYDGDTASSIFNHQYFQGDLNDAFPESSEKQLSGKQVKLGFVERLFSPLFRQRSS